MCESVFGNETCPQREMTRLPNMANSAVSIVLMIQSPIVIRLTRLIYDKTEQLKEFGESNV